MGFKSKLTEEQKATIFKKAMNGARTIDLAKEYHVSDDLIRRVKYDPVRIAAAEKMIDAHHRFLRLRIHYGAQKGVEKEHEILDREVPDGEKGTSLLYLQHQVASQMMDRDGLKAPEKSEQKVEIVFSSDGFEPGMPEESATSDDSEEFGEDE